MQLSCVPGILQFPEFDPSCADNFHILLGQFSLLNKFVLPPQFLVFELRRGKLLARLTLRQMPERDSNGLFRFAIYCTG